MVSPRQPRMPVQDGPDQGRHQVQRHLLSSLPAGRAIQRCTSWRSYNRHRPRRARNLRPPDHDDGITAPVTGLAAARIRRRRVLGGLIHEYERDA